MDKPRYSGMKCGKKLKYVVIKLDDLTKYVPVIVKIKLLETMLDDIKEGRKADGKAPVNEYIVVNTDEPYAGEVIEILKRHRAWGPEEAQA